MRLLLLLLPVYILSLMAMFYQHQTYFKALKVAKTKGQLVSTGKKKRYFSKGSIAIIVSDEQGFIRHGELLEGMTIFSKFKAIEGIEGLSLSQAEGQFHKKDSIVQAIGFIKEKLHPSDGLAPEWR